MISTYHVWSVLLFASLGGEAGAATSRLPIIEPAPDFALIDQHAKPLAMKDVKGQVLLVSFVFTTCTGSCPATTQRIVLAHDALAKRGLLKRGVRLLSISLDPVRDTPEVLRGYMKLYGIEGEHWSFLTGPPADVMKVYTAWGMWAKPAAGGKLDHPSRIFLVDRRGQIREVYNLDFLRPQWVVEDVELLLRDE